MRWEPLDYLFFASQSFSFLDFGRLGPTSGHHCLYGLNDKEHRTWSLNQGTCPTQPQYKDTGHPFLLFYFKGNKKNHPEIIQNYKQILIEKQLSFPRKLFAFQFSWPTLIIPTHHFCCLKLALLPYPLSFSLQRENNSAASSHLKGIPCSTRE